MLREGARGWEEGERGEETRWEVEASGVLHAPHGGIVLEIGLVNHMISVMIGLIAPCFHFNLGFLTSLFPFVALGKTLNHILQMKKFFRKLLASNTPWSVLQDVGVT